MTSILHNLSAVVTPKTRDGETELTVYKGFAIAFDTTIRDLSPLSELRAKYPDAQLIEGQEMMALPGFVDPHTHPVFYRTREEEFELRAAGKSYEEIAAAGGGIRNSVRAFRQASTDELLELTYQRIARFLEYGTTTLEAKSGYGLSVEDEIRSLRILKQVGSLLPITIVPTFLGAHEVPDEYRERRGAYIELIVKEMIPRVAEERLAVFCDVFCEEGVFSVEESERILLAAKDYGLIPKLHADELHYTGGAELAARLKAVSADHLLEVSEEGIQAMKEAGVVPVLLPGTAYFLGKTRYAPARKMLEAGLPVALATDFNPGSSMTQNMQQILNLACIYMGMSSREVLIASTLNSARAIGMAHRVGSLEPGKQADIILLDAPTYKYIPYHHGANHVKRVYRHGRLVYQAA